MRTGRSFGKPRRAGGRAEPAAVSPGDIAGLQAWFRADAIGGLSDGQDVTSWPDSSPNSADAAPVVLGNYPTFQTAELNGLPVVRWNQNRPFESAATEEMRTVFLVFKINSIVDFTDYLIQDKFVGNHPNVYFWAPGDVDTILLSTDGDEFGVAYSVGAWHILAGVFLGLGSKLWLDGALTTGTTDISEVPEPPGERGIVGPDGFSLSPSVDVAEMLTYESALDDTNVDEVASYLADKYALTWTDI